MRRNSCWIMRFGFGFRSTNSSSGGSSSGGGNVGHFSRGRSSKKVDDRPFPPQLEEHPYFNYFPIAQQNYYTRYLPRQPPAYQLPPPPPAPPTNDYRRRHGSFSENHGKHQQNAFHFRSRSSSGRFRHMKTPNDYLTKSNDTLNNNEPIYSEPFPPENEEPKMKFYPDPHDPVQISNHIYEYLVSKRVAQATSSSQENLINAKRRGSLSSSPSDGSSTNNSKHQPDFSSGKPPHTCFSYSKFLNQQCFWLYLFTLIEKHFTPDFAVEKTLTTHLFVRTQP